jgi:hypothetical protein
MGRGDSNLRPTDHQSDPEDRPLPAETPKMLVSTGFTAANTSNGFPAVRYRSSPLLPLKRANDVAAYRSRPRGQP